MGGQDGDRKLQLTSPSWPKHQENPSHITPDCPNRWPLGLWSTPLGSHAHPFDNHHTPGGHQTWGQLGPTPAADKKTESRLSHLKWVLPKKDWFGTWRGLGLQKTEPVVHPSAATTGHWTLSSENLTGSTQLSTQTLEAVTVKSRQLSWLFKAFILAAWS